MYRKITILILAFNLCSHGTLLVKFAAGKPAMADSVNFNFSIIDSVLSKVQRDHATYTSTEAQKSISDKFLVRTISDTAPIFLDMNGLNFQGSQSGFFLGYDWSKTFGLGYWKSTRTGSPFSPAITIANGVGITMLDKVTLQKQVITKDPAVSLPNVFDSSYSLATIDELSTFLKLTKTLPDYPTSAEVQSNGIELGKTNAMLVKKVEELTIYIIQLNSRIKALEAKP